jgi:hypothetical protein
MNNTKNILKGKEWASYINNVVTNEYKIKSNYELQTKLYSGITYKYVPIYKIGEYYTTMNLSQGYKGYKEISSIKSLISKTK